MDQFFENENRLILVREADTPDIEAWALGVDKVWRPTSQEFAGRVVADGNTLSSNEVDAYGADLTNPPWAESK